MFWFILCVAVLNVVAGFGLAVMLAGQCAACDDIQGSSGVVENTSSQSAQAVRWPETNVEGAQMEDPPVSHEKPAVDEQPELEVAPRGLVENGDISDSSVMTDLDAAVLAALGDGTLASHGEVAPSTTEEEVLGNRGDEALLAFQSRLETFCEELVSLDEQLRRTIPQEAVGLKVHLDALAASSKRQDKVCTDVAYSLREMISTEVIDAAQGEAMIAAIQEERQEAAETFESFGELENAADAASQCEMVLDRTAVLLEANHGMRDSVSDMILATDLPGETVGRTIDPLTEVLSRAGLDGILAEYWRDDPDRVRAAAFTLIDLDDFAKLNRRYGAVVGDRMLRAVAQLLNSESPPECRVGRFAGQRFALLSIDRDLKQAVADAEHLRQSIEVTSFEHGTEGLKITASCGVVALTSDDTQESLYARAVELVQEAKRYGRNRCAMREGEFSTPIVPPNLALNEKHVTL